MMRTHAHSGKWLPALGCGYCNFDAVNSTRTFLDPKFAQESDSGHAHSCALADLPIFAVKKSSAVIDFSYM